MRLSLIRLRAESISRRQTMHAAVFDLMVFAALNSFDLALSGPPRQCLSQVHGRLPGSNGGFDEISARKLLGKLSQDIPQIQAASSSPASRARSVSAAAIAAQQLEHGFVSLQLILKLRDLRSFHGDSLLEIINVLHDGTLKIYSHNDYLLLPD
jgi:hypothetical protein